jgi:hypothetical protein
MPTRIKCKDKYKKEWQRATKLLNICSNLTGDWLAE